jgi:Asp-tRNA(Asn)/Glu-tRNA(Gln) amidotransferase A subunit family amidase
MTDDGLPVGIQLVGRPYDEETLLELAVLLESSATTRFAPKGF